MKSNDLESSQAQSAGPEWEDDNFWEGPEWEDDSFWETTT